MSRTGMQTFNLLLLTVSIILGVAVTVTLICWIWIPDFTETAGLVLGTMGVLLAATVANWGVNAIFGHKIRQLFPRICYGISLLCIYAGVVLCILAIWGNATTEFMWRALGTLAVLFFASMIALAVSAIVQSSHSGQAPTPPPPSS